MSAELLAALGFTAFALLCLALAGLVLNRGRFYLREAQRLHADCCGIDCPACAGGGFTGRGTGYDDVCSECGGQCKMPRPNPAYISTLETL